MQLTAKLGAKDERIEALTAELARKVAEQAAAFVELDGARRHAMLQIDQARGEGRHWKEQFERGDQEVRTARTAADSYRGKASNLEAALAGANGRLSALQESLAAEQLRTAALSAQLNAEQDGSRRHAQEMATAHIAVEATNARLESAVRELAGFRDEVAEARVRERRAIEEAAELRGSRPASG